MNARLPEVEAPARTPELLQRELERRQGELEACRLRMGELKRAEALLAGEKRLLEMIAKGEGLGRILGAICQFGEEICADVLVSILLASPDGKSAEAAGHEDSSQAFEGFLRPVPLEVLGIHFLDFDATIIGDAAM